MENKKFNIAAFWISLIGGIISIIAFLTAKPYLSSYFESSSQKSPSEYSASSNIQQKVYTQVVDTIHINRKTIAKTNKSDIGNESKSPTENPNNMTTIVDVKHEKTGVQESFSAENDKDSRVITAGQQNIVQPNIEDCEKNNFGDYCFYNAGKKRLTVYIWTDSDGSEYFSGVRATYAIILKPNESKCLYKLPGNTSCYYMSQYLNEKYEEHDGFSNGEEQYIEYDKGQFLPEKCKKQTYTFK